MRSSLLSLLLLLLLLSQVLVPNVARASEEIVEAQAARFALIIGVNRAADPKLPSLQYADDDAARYQDLFRLLGARTYLLTRLDENTRRLHPQAAAEAHEPTKRELDEVVRQLTQDVAQAKSRSVSTVLYVVYAGHGDVEQGVGYLSLEDARLSGANIANDVLSRIDADQTHLIVDACYSYFLAYGRGPGGQRRPLHNFTEVPELAGNDRWGLLLSTSSARESHEWEGFQAGVFSHEVRSGLYGAADADGDGWVSYQEIAAFIEKANAAIPNEKYRPDVFARPPRQTKQLVDLRGASSHRLEIDGSLPAHYLLEDGRGVRLADFHNAPGQALKLLRPIGAGPLYLRRLDSDQEFQIGGGPDVLALADLQPTAPRTRVRGAAHDAFDLLFSLPFAETDVSTFQLRPATDLSRSLTETNAGSLWTDRHTWGWVSLGVALLGGGASGFTALDAKQLHNSAPSNASQVDIASRNTRINNDNRNTWIFGVVGGAAAVTGAALLLWPSSHDDASANASASAGSLTIEGMPSGLAVAYQTRF